MFFNLIDKNLFAMSEMGSGIEIFKGSLRELLT